MTATTLTLTDFLLARITEDEAVARAANSPRKWRGPETMGALEGGDSVLVDPARMLAECEAKRRIVEVAMPNESDDAGERGRILRILATVYAEHPSFREEWRP